MNVRTRLASAALVLTAPVLTSCSVNFGAQTDQVYTPGVGVNDRSGSVDVLGAVVVSGSAGSGTVVATLVNNDQDQGDTLTGVAGAGRDSSLTVTPGGPTDIPTDGLLNLADEGRIFVRGERVASGNFVSLTFSFQRGESVTVDAPVVDAIDEYSEITLPSGS